MAEQFTWTSTDGVTITLPPLSSVTAGTIRRHRHRDELDMMFSVLEEVTEQDEVEKIDVLPLAQLNLLFTAWQKSAGATVPQS